MVAELRLCIPSNKSWERFVEPKRRPAARYLMHVINSRRQAWRADRDGFVRLKCKYLQRVIDWTDLPKIQHALIKADVIERRKDFVPGLRSMRYRLTAQFSASTIEVCRDPVIVRRVQRIYRFEERRLLPIHRWLRGNLTEIAFDSDRAKSIISGMWPEPDSPLDEHEYRQLLIDQITSLADQISNGDVSLTCDRYGRVHSPIVRLPKSLRCCLSVLNRPLVAIDLVNSQPLIAGVVASAYSNAKKQARMKLRIWQPPTIPYGRQTRPARQPCSITVQEYAQPVGVKECYDICLRGPSDLQDYISVCEEGQFYESLNRNGSDRGDFKRRLFVDLFFGEDRHPSKIRDEFSLRYPTVARTISELKSDDYRRLAWLMQHEESKLFIGRICRRLMREQPSMPLYTIHDCLVTTVEHVNFVRSVAMDEFAVIGVVPRFTIEAWDDSI